MQPTFPFHRPDHRGIWRSYTLADGLVGLQVEHIAEDAEGYLWFATWDSGVSRYDGYEFHNFTRKDGLCGDQVMAIYFDEQGHLWFGTRDGGLCWYDGTSFHGFDAGDGVSDGSISFICPDDRGRLWFGGDNTLGYYDGTRFHNLAPTCLEDTGQKSALLGECHGIVQGRNGHIWFGFSRLLRYDGKCFCTYDLIDSQPTANPSYTYAIANDADGLLWVGGSDVIGRFDGEHFELLSSANGSLVRKIRHDREGRIWFSTSGGGVLCYEEERFVHFTARDGLAHDTVNDIYCDREGHIWFATWGGGVSAYDPESVRYFTTGDDLSYDAPFALLEDKAGGMWTGFVQSYASTEKSLAHYHGGLPKVWGKDQGLSLGQCWALCRGENGDIWLGGENGLVRYDGQHFISIEGFSDSAVYSLTTTDNGELIIGHGNSDSGAVQVSRTSNTRSEFRDDIILFRDENIGFNECITAIVSTRQGDIWFARSGRESRT